MIQGEGDFTGQGDILQVSSIRPNRSKHEIGKVSSVLGDCAVIAKSVIYNYDGNATMMVGEEYEYEAIESPCSMNNVNYEWRLTNLIKKIECEDDRTTMNDRGGTAVQMEDTTFRIKQGKDTITQAVSIYNISEVNLMLKNCAITSHSGLVKLDRKEINFTLTEKTGKFNIFLKINPNSVGSFIEELIADFGSFTKKCFVTVQIYDNCSVVRRTTQNGETVEFIPGRRTRGAPRFIEVRMKDFSIPTEFRGLDHKKKIELLIDDLKYVRPFLFEPLNAGNYYKKMRHCPYLEEIAMENQFSRYKISRGHFENTGDYLRLEVRVFQLSVFQLGVFTATIFTGRRSRRKKTVDFTWR